MKKREDFVSNSSSCSFIIEDTSAGLQALKELDILDADEFNDIEVLFTINKNTFTACNLDKYESWRDDQCGDVYCSCSPCELLRFPSQALQDIKDLSFSCDDYDKNALFILSLLYEVLNLFDVPINTACSEIDFPTTRGNNCVVAKLLNCLVKLKSRSK